MVAGNSYLKKKPKKKPKKKKTQVVDLLALPQWHSPSVLAQPQSEPLYTAHMAQISETRVLSV